MKTADFDYELPEGLIATRPAQRRDESRLMVVRREGPVGAAGLEHRVFSDLPEYLRAGDLLVLNDTRVIPARLVGRRPGGGRAEALLIEPVAGEGEAGRPSGEGGEARWRALVRPGKKLGVGAWFEVERPGEIRAGGEEATPRVVIEAELEAGERVVRLEGEGPVEAMLARWGRPPLPPYILRARKGKAENEAEEDAEWWGEDRERYQTVYAEHAGSVAAPTAGLHFTPELLGRLERQGVETARVTLHVGPGTFAPVVVEELERHRMHSERFRIAAEEAEKIQAAVEDPGRRVVAVGTTVTRVLETAMLREGRVRAQEGATDLMIAPGFEFRAVEALITNFHLPRSTLMALVSAFAGRERVLAAYMEAVRREYRFYSYGDAMLIL